MDSESEHENEYNFNFIHMKNLPESTLRTIKFQRTGLIKNSVVSFEAREYNEEVLKRIVNEFESKGLNKK